MYRLQGAGLREGKRKVGYDFNPKMEAAAVFKVRKPLFLGLRIDGTIKMLTAYDNNSQ